LYLNILLYIEVNRVGIELYNNQEGVVCEIQKLEVIANTPHSKIGFKGIEKVRFYTFICQES
jgi:hypothetical protein